MTANSLSSDRQFRDPDDWKTGDEPMTRVYTLRFSSKATRPRSCGESRMSRIRPVIRMSSKVRKPRISGHFCDRIRGFPFRSSRADTLLATLLKGHAITEASA